MGEGGAGEGGAGVDCVTKTPYSVMYPAAYPQVIAVGAVDSYKEPAWFSNTGPETDVLAPGVNVVSTNLYDGFGIANGTSMATPHVTGAVALMLALAEIEGVDLTPDRIKSILRDTALDGMIDLTAALNQVHAESLAGSLVNTTNDMVINTVGRLPRFLHW
jgi:subtilisin family serine protease